MSEIRFDGRVAIVTGAGGGLGRSHALLLASRGAKVVVNDLGGARDGTGAGGSAMADKVVDEIKAAGGEAVANYDASNLRRRRTIVKTALDTFGGIDIVINNAGILRDRAFQKLTQEDWDLIYRVHVLGSSTSPTPRARHAPEQLRPHHVHDLSPAFTATSARRTTPRPSPPCSVLPARSRSKARSTTSWPTHCAHRRLAPDRDVMPPAALEGLKPEYVSPVVAYLCSEECQVSGNIFTAGAGYVGRAAIVESKGAVLGTGITIEDVRDNIGKITDMTGAEEFTTLSTKSPSA